MGFFFNSTQIILIITDLILYVVDELLRNTGIAG